MCLKAQISSCAMSDFRTEETKQKWMDALVTITGYLCVAAIIITAIIKCS